VYKVSDFLKNRYNGNLTIIDKHDGEYIPEKTQLREKAMVDGKFFSDEIEDGNGVPSHYALLQDIVTLKHVMAFAEVTRYKEKLLTEMTIEEREKVIKIIVGNLDSFDVKPVCYEITEENSIVLAWYLNEVIDALDFLDPSLGLAW
jgi:hypothetical protein